MFSSKDFKVFSEFNDVMKKYLGKDAYLVKNDQNIKIVDFMETYKWIINEAKKGFMIQRYKGLGEMNPDKLWETTMDPENRSLIRIFYEDEAAADQLFEDLMGDNVAPRKLFIEENARFAGNIDI